MIAQRDRSKRKRNTTFFRKLINNVIIFLDLKRGSRTTFLGQDKRGEARDLGYFTVHIGISRNKVEDTIVHNNVFRGIINKLATNSLGLYKVLIISHSHGRSPNRLRVPVSPSNTSVLIDRRRHVIKGTHEGTIRQDSTVKTNGF